MDKAEAFDALMAFVNEIVRDGEEMHADPDYFRTDDFAHAVVEEAEKLVKRIKGE